MNYLSKKIYIGLIFFLNCIGVVQAQQSPTEQGDSAPAISTPATDASQTKKNIASHKFSGFVAFVSDYRIRGISQTMRRPAIQGNLDYQHEKGVYLGMYGSNVDGTTNYYNNASLEWDFYIGYKNKFSAQKLPDLTYNFGFFYYYYPAGQTKQPKPVRYNTGEFYIEVAYKWLSVKYWQTVTNYFGFNALNPPYNWKKNEYSRANGNTKGSKYLDVNVNFDLYQQLNLFDRYVKFGKLNLLMHVGYQYVRNYEKLNYMDWRATLTQTFDWFNLFIAYVGTNAKKAYFDVPDNAYHPNIRKLGGRELIVGIIRVF